MTHPTLEDAARAAEHELRLTELIDAPPSALRVMKARRIARAVLLSIRPPDREDLPLRQLEARDYIDGIIGKREIEE